MANAANRTPQANFFLNGESGVEVVGELLAFEAAQRLDEDEDGDAVVQRFTRYTVADLNQGALAGDGVSDANPLFYFFFRHARIDEVFVEGDHVLALLRLHDVDGLAAEYPEYVFAAMDDDALRR